MSAVTVEQVLHPELDRAAVEALVARRSLRARTRAALGRAEPVVLERQLYWPIALVHATARSSGRRRQWVERVRGAVDLVTGRTGLVDVDLPVPRDLELGPEDRVPGRLSRTAAQDAWHEFFRDHVDRRYKPMSPPELTVDRFQRLWLTHHVVAVGGRRYLVDPMVARCDPLHDVPPAERMVRAAPPTAPPEEIDR